MEKDGLRVLGRCSWESWTATMTVSNTREQLPCFPFFLFALWLAKEEGKLMQLVLGVVLLLVTLGLDVHEEDGGGKGPRPAAVNGGGHRSRPASSQW